MIGCIDIEFRPQRETIPKILGIIDEQGYTLRGIRLIPGAERGTLKVDIGGCRATPEVLALADKLLALDDTVSVIHGAKIASAA